jgi:hypothetical protein
VTLDAKLPATALSADCDYRMSTYAVHRLVQDFTKRGMLEENRRDYARQLVNIVKPPENPE